MTVGDTSQRVTELSLPERQLTGRVAPELGRLSGLQLLDLLGNGLSGNMPRELARLASLRSLSVSNNRLSGEIPAELGNLTELITLDLAFNRLSGPIPPELGRLSHLTRLKIDHNQLTGEIPSELLSLSNLSWLFLGDNHLTGRIPPDLGRLARLSLLDLGTNQFTGPIPPELGRLTGLIRLDLDQNQLDGQIPPQLGSLSNLDILRLSGNQLTGQIPPELAGLSKLDWLLLSHNQLTGEVPPDLGRLASLTLLDLGGNRLTGQIPPELGDLSQLDGLSLHSNKLTGGIPAELGRLSKLHSLSLDGNRLSGPIPPELRGLTNVVVVELRNNELSGEIPSALGSLVNLEALYLSNNRLIGEIPAELGTLPNLDLVNLSGNKLTGCVPGRLRAVESNDLARLGLPFCAVALDDDDEASCSNGIAVPGPDDNPGLVSDCEALLAARDTLAGTGSLDWSAGVPIGQWDGVGLGGTPKRVARLNLSARQLTGEIPVELGDLANLDTLGLDYNRLTGGIPPELGHLPNLFWLLLTGNRLTGQIPPGLGRNASLDVLDLGGNQLTGQIPPELGDLSNLSTLALNNNKLTGEIPAELGRLSTLFSLYLNGNRLSGPIPPELRGLVNVVVVDLRGNELSGEIPSALSSLVNLESLSLSDNRLIGEIPAELGTLKNLDLVHLSDNRLNGCVPGGLRVAYYNDFDRLRLPFCDLLLNDLVVTPGSLTPPFDRYHTDYTAEVSTPIVTILPTGGHNAALQVLGGDDHELEDADSNLPGIQVAAGAAFIRITVRVVAADGKATRTYTIGIRRVLGAPTAAAVEAGGGYLTVSWAAPDEFAEARTASYDLRYIPTAADEAVDANWTVVENAPTYSAGGDLQYTITGLSAGTQYEVQVRAVDRGGEPAAWSASVTGTPTTPSVCVTGGAIAVVINPGIVSDCESLLAARDALAGDGRLNWSASTAIKDWDGVTVGGTPPRVVGLSVNSRGLDGTIPAELGDLTGLRRLDLFENRLTGPIPAELGKLADLQSLDLSDNRLTGQIPSQLGVLGELRSLFLQRNDLVGVIPSALGFLDDLAEADLSGNNLLGCAPPIANDHTGPPCFVAEGTTLTVDTLYLLTDDGARITAVGDATNGLVTLDGDTIFYRHDGSETKTGSFTYTVTDGAERATASVIISVSPENDPPIGETDALAVQEGGTVSVQAIELLANDTDPDLDTLNITAVGDATNGLVALDGDTIFYRHDGSETNAGSFTYTVTDGTDTATVLVTVSVSPVNDPPNGVDDALDIEEGDTVSIASQQLLANDSDAEGDALRITAVGDAINGVVTLDGNTIFYRHDGSETTSGSFAYTVSDGIDSTTALVTVAVRPVNDPPTGVDDAFAVKEGGMVTVQAQRLLDNDTDAEGDPLNITAVGDATNGLVALDGNTISYEHDGSETNADSFTYAVTDGTDTTTVLVTVTVSPANDTPVGVDDTLAVEEGGMVTVQAQRLLDNDTDAEGDALRITAVGDAINGVVTLDGNTISYEHDGSETLTGSFTYTVSDDAETAIASVTVTVSPVNDPPVGVDDTLAVREGGTVSVASQQLLANDTDAEGDALRIIAVGGAVNGLATLDGSTISYEHDGSETLTGSFTYTVSDRTDSATVLVTISVSPVDDLPVLLLVAVALGAGLLVVGAVAAFAVRRTRRAA